VVAAGLKSEYGPILKEEPLSLIHRYHCEICGTEKRAINNWFMAEVMPTGVLLSHWREERAQTMGMHHFCGEAHAQVFVSRYLTSPGNFTNSKPPALNPHDKDLTAVQSHLVSKVLQQPSEMSEESEEIFDLLAAAEAALKGKVTIDSLNSDHFDA
jgi:hypothetical protein